MTSTFQGFTLFSHQFEAYYGKRYFVYRIPWKSALKSSDVRDNVKHEHNSRIVTMSPPLFSCRFPPYRKQYFVTHFSYDASKMLEYHRETRKYKVLKKPRTPLKINHYDNSRSTSTFLELRTMISIVFWVWSVFSYRVQRLWERTIKKHCKNKTLEILSSISSKVVFKTTIPTISTLSSSDRLDVEGNNRFVFGFITLVGNIWHRTFRPQQLHPPLCGCAFLPPPCLGYASVSRVEKFSFVLDGVSLPRGRITVARSARSVNIVLEISLWTGSSAQCTHWCSAKKATTRRQRCSARDERRYITAV